MIEMAVLLIVQLGSIWGSLKGGEYSKKSMDIKGFAICSLVFSSREETYKSDQSCKTIEEKSFFSRDEILVFGDKP